MPGRSEKRRTIGGRGRRLAVPLALAAALVVSACQSANDIFAPAGTTAYTSSPKRDWEDFPDIDFARTPRDESLATLGPSAPWPASPPPPSPSGPSWRKLARQTPAPPLNDDPDQVMGLDDEALEALIGPPGLRRDEHPAQVWQYRGESCVLDLFLYPDDEAEPHRVVYYEIRGDDDGALARRRCFRALLRARAAG